MDQQKNEQPDAGETADQLDHTGGAGALGKVGPADEDYVARHSDEDTSTDTGIASAGPVGDPNDPRDVGTSADAGHSGGVGQTGEKRGAAGPK